jgi:dTDP-4-dehydrorhamnose 3,5-epimerase
MEFKELELEGAFLIKLNHFQDDRGAFIKSFHHDFFEKAGLPQLHFTENYFSISHKNVIRGMHFQKPPHDHHKLVFLSNGKAIDVILDLRKSSKTYGKCVDVVLDAENPHAVFIPKGMAHGFKSLENNTCMHYLLTSVYNTDADGGIAYNSFGYDWKIENPILSKRDLSFENLVDFKSMFTDV